MRIPSLLALAFSFTLSIYGLNASAELSEEIQLAFNQGDFASAFDMVEQALVSESEDQQLLLAKGYLLVKLNRLDAAIEYYQKLNDHLNENPEPGNNLAMVYRMQHQYDQAITRFEQTIERFPDYAHAYENLGDTYVELAHNQYQAGFNASGQNLLKKKINLSQNFHQIAVQSSPKQTSHHTDTSSQAVANTGDTSPARQESTEIDAPKDAPQTAILNTLDAWIKDWMSLNPERYLSHYSRKFTPNDNTSIEQWVAHKKRVFAQAGNINLKLRDINVEFEQANLAVANFTQEYKSKTFKDTTHKALRLENDQGRWLILEEISEN